MSAHAFSNCNRRELSEAERPEVAPSVEPPLEALLAEQPFFRGLTSEQFRTLVDNAMQRRFDTGELIFREGDLANRFYLIRGGKVALESSVKTGNAAVLQTLGPGDPLGWSWLFSPYVWRLRARAVEPTEAIIFYGTRLREQCEPNHHLGYELLKRISEVIMQPLQIARGRFLDHLAECHPRMGAETGGRKTPAVQ